MSIRVAFYNLVTGRIRATMEGSPEQIGANVLDGESYKVITSFNSDVSDETHYVDIESEWHGIAQRQAYTLDALPLPCTLKIDGERYDITEQPDLSFEWPGAYVINVIPESPAFLEMEFTRTVTESDATGVPNAEPNY